MKKLPTLNTLSLTLIITVLCSQNAFGNSTPAWLSISGNNEAEISVSIISPLVELTEFEFDGQSFSQIDINADVVIGKMGGPVLPGWSKWIELPSGMKPTLTIQEGVCETIADIKIAPFPISDINSSDAVSLQQPNPANYASNELIPAKPATISDVLTIGGTRFAVLTVSPYQYNPHKEELYVFDNLKVDVSFESDPAAKVIPERQIAPAMSELVRSLSDQPPRRDEDHLHQNNLGGYVIVTDDNDDVIEAVEPLAEWKRRKGFEVTMMNMGGIDGREGLRDSLRLGDWEMKPTFVLLAGDGNGDFDIPFYNDGQAAMQSWSHSDNQFVIWDYENPEGPHPEEWIPNAFIGPLPAERISEMEHIVAKILAYEI
ncbi:hypothetical protein K9N50_03050, partial [bacterium]|nr:hypothetical protein [bacterium]